MRKILSTRKLGTILSHNSTSFKIKKILHFILMLSTLLHPNLAETVFKEKLLH